LVRLSCCLFAIFFITSCTINTRSRIQNDSINTTWRGRLAIEVAPAEEHNSTVQSFSASFELTGNSESGELVFLTPLGTTAAAVQWTPIGAEMVTQGKARSFDGLGALMHDLLGTNIPITALFAWLNGRDWPVEGWQVDLTRFAQGKITAQRLSVPQARLRLILEP
jgi:outer membrane lipoprotein LolB